MSIYAVNGKEPIAAWIESLDPEAVTSSKATDLVGTNHGTLTNMDLVADPLTARRLDSDAGGVRALDFDGVNDCVRCGSALNASLQGVCSYSFWGKFRRRVGVNALLSNIAASGERGQQLEIGRSMNRLAWLQNGQSVDATSTGSITDANWHHVVVVRTGSAGAWTITFWIDGASSSHSTAVNPWPNTAQNGQFTIGRVGDFDQFFQADFVCDDLRLFNQALDGADVSYLYAGGFGRGIVAATEKKRPRVNGSLINSGLCRSKT